MAKKPENPQARPRANPKRPASGRGRRIVRTLAKSTLFAAGFAATQLNVAEIDSRFRMFDRTLMDRLHAPITRYHE